ncbi:hypothetical protein RBB78_01505 [Tunturiibacter empetritectus]
MHSWSLFRGALGCGWEGFSVLEMMLNRTAAGCQPGAIVLG